VRAPQGPYKIRMPRLLLLAVLAAAIAGATAGSALAHGARLPDAEIFATNNTAIITDPADPRLSDPLLAFGHKVERIVEHGSGEPRERLFGGSVTLDGRLVLIAGLEDVELVRRFVTEIGGDFGAATIRSGHREFVG
jgi:hypothetical protein